MPEAGRTLFGSPRSDLIIAQGGNERSKLTIVAAQAIFTPQTGFLRARDVAVFPHLTGAFGPGAETPAHPPEPQIIPLWREAHEHVRAQHVRVKRARRIEDPARPDRKQILRRRKARPVI